MLPFVFRIAFYFSPCVYTAKYNVISELIFILGEAKEPEARGMTFSSGLTQ